MRIRIPRLLVLMAALVMVNCGLWAMKTSNTKPDPKSNPDMATLVIMRTTSYGYAASVSNYLDGKLIGQTKGKSYFITEIPPGKHSIICKNENMRPHFIDFEAGKVYYLQQAIYMGVWGARTEYDTLNPMIFEEQKPECEFFVFDPAEAEGDDEAVVDMDEAAREREEQMKDESEYFLKVDNCKGF
jgi:hypothetical protein